MTQNILANYNSFIEKILNELAELKIDVTHLNMDHLAYQAASDAEYDSLQKEFSKLGSLVSENVVNGRRVGIFKLHTPLQFQHYINTAIELVAPRKDQVCESGLEHVEFVIEESFADFLKKYPDIAWDTAAINQPEFPLIRLRLDQNTQVKFHLQPVLEIVGKNHKN